MILIAVTWIYLLSSSIANAFTALIDVSGVVYASFYLLTALSAIVYYRRRIFSNAWDAVPIGILPWPLPVPGLDRRQVGPERAPVAAVVADRRRGGRRDLDAGRAVYPAVTVLPRQARERSQVAPRVSTLFPCADPMLPPGGYRCRMACDWV